MDEKGLLPCPFCAGRASMCCGGPGCYFVQCDGCNATSDDHSEERAIAAWNRRAYLNATQAKAPDVVGVLRNAIKWIEVEYADARCEPEGEWLAPEARHQHRKLCELLASLSKGSEGGAK